MAFPIEQWFYLTDMTCVAILKHLIFSAMNQNHKEFGCVHVWVIVVTLVQATVERPVNSS
uniref:Uncharacterized protein n=1 Tax=Brugia malayi TaxID=6279 RepID=A8Q436_BRUMA